MWPDVSSIEGVGEVMITIAVQVNGKLRGTVEMSAQDAKNQEAVTSLVMQSETIKKWVTGEVKKTIFVPGKLVNIVM